MIKMISFNNFDNFEAKTNSQTDAGREAQAQDFSAILSGFSSNSTRVEIVSQKDETPAGSDFSGSNASETPEIFREGESAVKSESIFSSRTIDRDALSQNEDLSAAQNPAFPKQNTDAGQIPVNPADKEISAAEAGNGLPDFQNNSEDKQTAPKPAAFAEIPPEGRILTQFDNQAPKQNSVWNTNQMPGRAEAENPVHLTNAVNEKNRQASVRFVIDQDNILDLPKNDFQPEANAGASESNQILAIENAGGEMVEIVSNEMPAAGFSGKTEPEIFFQDFLKKDPLPGENKTISAVNILREEDSLRPKLVMTQATSEIKLPEENYELEKNPARSFENPAAAESAMLNAPELQMGEPAEKVFEIKTDNFDVIDLSEFRTAEISRFEDSGIKQAGNQETTAPAAAENSQKFAENDLAPEDPPVYKVFENGINPGDSSKIEPNLPERTLENQPVQEVKTENKPAAETNQKQISNQESAQINNLKYFFNPETNRVDEVKNIDIAETKPVSDAIEAPAMSIEQDLAAKPEPANNLSAALYGGSSQTAPELNSSEDVQIQTKIAAEDPIELEMRKLWSNPAGENQIHATNAIRANSKSRDIFTKDFFDKNGGAGGEVKAPSHEDAAPSQIANPAASKTQETLDFIDRKTISQIQPPAANILEKPIPKPEKPFSMNNEFAGLNFEKFLNPLANEHGIIEVAPNAVIEDAAVFEQIEPKIVELAALVEKSGETEILKMRLNPAELGGVEIRLERDASGNINGHFQTETESARQILTENLEQLRDSLKNSGLQVEKLEVTCNPNQTGGNESRENGSGQTENGADRTGGNAPGFGVNEENAGEEPENPAHRLVNLRA